MTYREAIFSFFIGRNMLGIARDGLIRQDGAATGACASSTATFTTSTSATATASIRALTHIFGVSALGTADTRILPAIKTALTRITVTFAATEAHLDGHATCKTFLSTCVLLQKYDFSPEIKKNLGILEDFL